MPRYLETIPTAGYRFIANVNVVTAADPSPDPGWIAQPDSEAGAPAPIRAEPVSRERMWQLAAGVAAVLLLASAVWIAVHLRNEPAPAAMVQFQISRSGQAELLFRPATGGVARRPAHRVCRVTHSLFRHLQALCAFAEWVDRDRNLDSRFGRPISFLVARWTADRVRLRLETISSGPIRGTARYRLCRLRCRIRRDVESRWGDPHLE